MEKATIIGTAPRFFVEDIEATLHFYIEELGFNFINSVPSVYGIIERDGYQIHFEKFNKQVPNKNQVQHLILWIPEIRSFFEEVAEKNVKIIEPITQRIYGNREFVIEDINKNILIICD